MRQNDYTDQSAINANTSIQLSETHSYPRFSYRQKWAHSSKAAAKARGRVEGGLPLLSALQGEAKARVAQMFKGKSLSRLQNLSLKSKWPGNIKFVESIESHLFKLKKDYNNQFNQSRIRSKALLQSCTTQKQPCSSRASLAGGDESSSLVRAELEQQLQNQRFELEIYEEMLKGRRAELVSVRQQNTLLIAQLSLKQSLLRAKSERNQAVKQSSRTPKEGVHSAWKRQMKQEVKGLKDIYRDLFSLELVRDISFQNSGRTVLQGKESLPSGHRTLQNQSSNHNELDKVLAECSKINLRLSQYEDVLSELKSSSYQRLAHTFQHYCSSLEQNRQVQKEMQAQRVKLEQVLQLLARQKGSAILGIGERQQPSQVELEEELRVETQRNSKLKERAEYRCQLLYYFCPVIKRLTVSGNLPSGFSHREELTALLKSCN